jgi:hypothetical protein
VNDDLDGVRARLARSFPGVEARTLAALVVTCYRVISRSCHDRRLDRVEALCRLRLTDQGHADQASAARSARAD